MMIRIREYAERLGKSPDVIRYACIIGRFKTAQKEKGIWLIDEDEPYPADSRLKSGKYVGWRKKPRNKRVKNDDYKGG